jgi:hypothetical protein
MHNLYCKGLINLLCILLAFTSGKLGATVGDSRFAVSTEVMPGWNKLDEVGACWWLNWDKSLDPAYANDNYPYVRMYWRTKAGQYSDETIQNWARTARALYGPNVTIWWTASNEPNDRGQANQTPAEFAAGYYQYYKNLKIGDPTCKVLGPGILNWTFQSDSVWMKGKDWYEEFRQVWANNPVYAAYSMSIQGNPYPPMDAFNLHTYDLRGLQGTPWQGPPDWKYLRDETLACYADLQQYPETQNLKIWITEYGSLRTANMTETADTLGPICLWFRQQPFIERWFFFILRSRTGAWPNMLLLDINNNITPLGKAHWALSTMGDEEVYNLPFNAEYNSGTAYTRPGYTYTTKFAENYTLGLNIYPQQGQTYNAGEMRGRTYVVDRRIKRLTFNYRMTCNPSLYQIEVDIPGHPAIWISGSNTGDQWADIDLSSYNTDRVSIGLYCTTTNTYSDATGSATAKVTNITLWLYPKPSTPVVDDHGPFTTNTNSLSASWTCDSPKSPIVEYQYSISTASGTEIIPWTSAQQNTSVTVSGLSLSLGTKYIWSVRAKTADGVWSDVGTSRGITVVSATGTPGEIKNNPTGTLVGFSGIVTANANNITRAIFVEAPDRSSAIRVYQNTGVPNPDIGSIVHVVGKLAEISGERVIGNTSLTIVGSAPEPIKPIFLPNKAIGGGALNPYTPGITNGYGPYNIALLVQTSGKVLYVDPVSKLFFIDDGSDVPNGDRRGVAVSYDVVSGTITPPSVGQNVIVTGLSAIRNYGGNRYPLIRLRSQSDITIVE